MDLIIFSEQVGQSGRTFMPGAVYAFEDPDAAPYFKACGWAKDAPAKAVADVVVTMTEIDIDPCTIWGGGSLGQKGTFVMPDRAAAARGTSLEAAQAYVWDGSEDIRNG